MRNNNKLKIIRCYIKTHLIPTVKDESLIPHGMYCYDYNGGNHKMCPYWVSGDGYIAGCRYLREVDRSGLLWDGCKECDINKGI